jgi:hypothetical protein
VPQRAPPVAALRDNQVHRAAVARARSAQRVHELRQRGAAAGRGGAGLGRGASARAPAHPAHGVPGGGGGAARRRQLRQQRLEQQPAARWHSRQEAYAARWPARPRRTERQPFRRCLGAADGDAGRGVARPAQQRGERRQAGRCGWASQPWRPPGARPAICN